MSAERALTDALTSAVVVGPEDRLVLVFEGLTEADLARVRESLDAIPFGDRVLIVGGPAELAVLRGEA